MTPRNKEFEGRHVVVTGATGALGGAVVTRLVEGGATCHLPARSPKAAERFADRSSGHVQLRSGIDLTDERSVVGFYEQLPGLWASIHCAGGFAMAPIVGTSLEDFSRMWAMNVTSAFLCSREATRVFRAGRSSGNENAPGGRIVNVAARAALEPRTGAGMTSYTATKAAVTGMTLALAEELADEDILVNAVAPSIIDTPANRSAMPQADFSKWPTVDEVAETIVFLASPSNRVTRGGVVPVYGKS